MQMTFDTTDNYVNTLSMADYNVLGDTTRLSL